MLIEELFGRRIMVMGPAKDDPTRLTGTFNVELLATFPALKAAVMEKMRRLEGEWDSVNRVPATNKNPAYEEVNTGKHKFCEKDSWICLVGKDGRERRYLGSIPSAGSGSMCCSKERTGYCGQPDGTATEWRLRAK